MKVLCIGSYAPYLGGPATWEPLKAALGNAARIAVLDPLDVLVDANPPAAFGRLVEEHIEGSDVAIAHGLGAAYALRHSRNRRIVLLNPVLSEKGTSRGVFARAVKALLASSLGSGLMRRAASNKATRLQTNPAALEKELSRLCGPAIDASVRTEALERVRSSDPEDLARSTALLMRSDFGVERADSQQIDVICSTGSFTHRIMRPRLHKLLPNATFHQLGGCGDAAMLDRPQYLAEIILRESPREMRPQSAE